MGRSDLARWVSALVLVAAGSNARAQSSADAAFDRGLADMQAGKYDTGCPALAESYKLDPQPGALFTLATCEQRWGKPASSMRHFQEYLRVFETLSAAQRAQQKDRDKIAREEIERLKPHVARLTLALPPSAPPGTTVEHEGRTIDPIAQRELQVDPGDHVLIVRAPGRPPSETRVSAGDGEKVRVELTLGGVTGGGDEPPPDEPAAAAGSSSRLPWILLAGGVGLTGLAVGAVTGGMVFAEKSNIEDHCDEDLRCDESGLEAVDRGQTLGLVSTIGFGVGVAGVAAAIVLLVTQPPTPDTSSVTRRLRVTVIGSPGAGRAGVVLPW